MKPTPSQIRLHRIFGCVAVLHAASLSVFILLWMFHYGSTSLVQERLWVGFATLWLLWPIILALHAGRSIFRFGIPFVISLLILIPSIREYPRTAPYSFGLPPSVDLSPHSIGEYLVAYRLGRLDAKKDIQSGRLVIETDG